MTAGHGPENQRQHRTRTRSNRPLVVAGGQGALSAVSLALVFSGASPKEILEKVSSAEGKMRGVEQSDQGIQGSIVGADASLKAHQHPLDVEESNRLVDG